MLVQKFQMMKDRVIYMILVIYMIVTYDLLNIFMIKNYSLNIIILNLNIQNLFFPFYT